MCVSITTLLTGDISIPSSVADVFDLDDVGRVCPAGDLGATDPRRAKKPILDPELDAGGVTSALRDG